MTERQPSRALEKNSLNLSLELFFQANKNAGCSLSYTELIVTVPICDGNDSHMRITRVALPILTRVLTIDWPGCLTQRRNAEKIRGLYAAINEFFPIAFGRPTKHALRDAVLIRRQLRS